MADITEPDNDVFLMSMTDDEAREIAESGALFYCVTCHAYHISYHFSITDVLAALNQIRQKGDTE